MLLRKLALLLLIVAIVLGGVAGYLAWERGGRLYSDPAAPRPAEAYERLLSPPPVVRDISSNFFARVTIEHTTNQLIVRAPARSYPEPEPFVAKLHRPGEAVRVAVGDGSISLAGIGVGWAVVRTNIDYTVRVPGAFFGPELKPLESNEIARLTAPWGPGMEFRGTFPEARFIFERAKIPEMKMLAFNIFDGRTHQELSQGGFSSSYQGDIFWYECQPALWHQTPLDLFLTVAVGPVQTLVAPAKTGETVPFPGGAFELLAIVPGGVTGFNTRNDGKTNETTLPVRGPKNPWARGEESTAIFMTYPASDLPLDVDFLDDTGKVLTSGRAISGAVSTRVLDAATNQITQVRLKYYPVVHRIIFRIPELPGLPEENRGLKNLFDAHIPCIHFNGEWDYQTAVAQLIQMKMPPLPLNYTNSYFPVIFTDTTTRELFRKLNSRLANPEEELRINEAAKQVELKRSPFLVFLEQFRKLLPR